MQVFAVDWAYTGLTPRIDPLSIDLNNTPALSSGFINISRQLPSNTQQFMRSIKDKINFPKCEYDHII